MSQDSLAMFRKGLGPEMGALAEQHFEHDLQESDRTALLHAASKISTYVTAGSALGLTLALLASYRLRTNRRALFRAIKGGERPTAVKFASGKEEALPDLTKFMRPSRVGDVATFTLLGAGGLFLGGELGLLGGTFAARRGIGADREGRERIERAFKRFRADVLRKQADELDKSERSWL